MYRVDKKLSKSLYGRVMIALSIVAIPLIAYDYHSMGVIVGVVLSTISGLI